MLMKMLQKPDQIDLFHMAQLLAIADKPLLLNGKPLASVSLAKGMTIDDLSFQHGSVEQELLADMAKSIGDESVTSSHVGLFRRVGAEERLKAQLKDIPLSQLSDEPIRAGAAIKVLNRLFKKDSSKSPSIPKIMLFEMMLVALRDGHISGIEMLLLREFQHYHEVEDCIFDELLKRAEALNMEVGRTISIVLE